MWQPSLTGRTGALYARIVEALAEDVLAGRLPPDEKLPTHRELAEALDVTVTTVGRAYAEAERRGLISGEVGRGTFVRSMAGGAAESDASGPIDLSLNTLFPTPLAEDLIGRLGTFGTPVTLARYLDYQPHAGALRHREAGARWMVASGLTEATAAGTLITAGAQNAMAVVFAALARPGDVVLTEPMTYTGMKLLAHHQRLRLAPVDADRQGLTPNALRAACRKTKARLLYTMPTVQNPLSLTMSEARRRDVAAVARSLDLTIVEDDTYGFLEPKARPLAALAPERTVYLTSFSKNLAPGLRIGLILAPAAMTEKLVAALFALTVEASPVTAELVSAWIEDGTAESVSEWKRRELAARQELARRIFKGLRLDAAPSGPHVWLHLPAKWRAGDLVAAARTRGVLVSAGEEFSVSNEDPKAVRISLGPPRDRARLQTGLSVIADVLSRPPEPYRRVV